MTARVYLIGFMGSGKSTLGRWLADALDWNFIDLDNFIENKHHKTIPQIFEEYGEDKFREIESSCLKEISKFNKVIVGAGGGTPCFFNNIEIMNTTGLSVYLQLTPKAIYDRLQTSKSQRPLIAGKKGDELLDFICNKLTDREKYYKKALLIADAQNWQVKDYITALENFH